VSPSLEQLMTRYQQGDREAAEALVDAVSPQFFRFFLGCVGDRAHAEDLLQDFWLRMHAARRSYRPPAPVLPWMYAIARRVRVDGYRRTKRVSGHEVQMDELPEVPVPAQRKDERELAVFLEQLPESQQEVILMLKVSGLTLEEVAAATRTSVGAVKQKAHRAYERLRSLMRKPVHGSPF